MKVGSLFSGIGGIDRGLEMAGMSIEWQCEIDEFCQDVLRRHWPKARLYEDVREVDSSAPRIDLLCGGFPCPSISSASDAPRFKQDERWLWPEMARVIDALKPAWVLIENVEGLRDRGLDEILRFLSKRGYDAEWDRLSAAAFAAPHERPRYFIVAYTPLCGYQGCVLHRKPPRGEHAANGGRSRKRVHVVEDDERGTCDPGGFIFEGERPSYFIEPSKHWQAEPGLVRMADGFPYWMDARKRIKALGNAVVPQIPEWIGRQIMSAELMRSE